MPSIADVRPGEERDDDHLPERRVDCTVCGHNIYISARRHRPYVCPHCRGEGWGQPPIPQPFIEEEELPDCEV